MNPTRRGAAPLPCLPLLALAFFLLFAGGAGARETGLRPQQAQAVRAAIRAEMHRQHVVGAAVGYLDRDQILFCEGFGYADFGSRRAFTDRTVVNLCSNSKPLVAILAMQLVERGLLDLDADVRDRVPEYPAAEHPFTARHLLCHQSGLPHYSNGKVAGTDHEAVGRHPYLDPMVSLNCFNRSPLLFKPGERESYSSYAYVLLSALVQQAGGEPLADQLSSRIAVPLGLKSLQLDLPEEGDNWSTPYFGIGGIMAVRVPPTAHYWKHGAGGYMMHARDFARWAQALLRDELIACETRERMSRLPIPAGGGRSRFGLGLIVEGEGESLRLWHGGALAEARTHLAIYPAQGRGVVVLCNCGHAKPSRIARLVLEAVDTAAPGAADPQTTTAGP